MIIKGGVFSLMLIAGQCYAGVMPSQSRVVYHHQDREQTIMLANTNDYPVITQTWVDRGEGSPDTLNIPFISIPPIIRLAPGDIKGIRIIYNQGKVPQDRESLFWLNMYEVPPEKKGSTPENSILVIMNTQMKLFYRPKGIISTPEVVFPRVSCKKISASQISCSNPGAIHLSIISMTLDTASGKNLSSPSDDFILPPFSEKTFNFPEFSGIPKKITVEYINDFGDKKEALIENIR